MGYRAVFLLDLLVLKHLLSWRLHLRCWLWESQSPTNSSSDFKDALCFWLPDALWPRPTVA